MKRPVHFFIVPTLCLAAIALLSCSGVPNQAKGLNTTNPTNLIGLTAIQPHPELSLGAETADWYKDAVFYHIWISAFNDSSGDGIGDIAGIIERLDYLQELGITALWLSPFFESSSSAINLHMYDTTDHYRVDPRFGTEEDVDRLLLAAHQRGMRVIFDWVPNHVSAQHPWFMASARGDPDYADWFVWRDQPGSQNGPWGQTVWHRNRNGRYYYGVFWSGMPDLNYRSQAAKIAITNVAIHWLNRGFDGIRVDAVKYLYEDPETQRGGYMDQPENYAYFQALRSQVLDEFANHEDRFGQPTHKFMVAENWTSNLSNIERYMVHEDRPGFHMSFDFALAEILARRDAGRLHNQWTWQTERLHPNAWMGTFLSNHDDVAIRPFSQHVLPLYQPVLAALLLGPGTPFVYYGNEIGMEDARQFAGASHADRRHRQAMDWEAAKKQLQEPDSLLNMHRRLIQLRMEHPSLRRGDYRLVARLGNTLVFTRGYGNQTSLIAINFGATTLEVALQLEMDPEAGRLLYQSQGNSLHWDEGRLTGQLAAAGIAVWLFD